MQSNQPVSVGNLLDLWVIIRREISVYQLLTRIQSRTRCEGTTCLARTKDSLEAKYLVQSTNLDVKAFKIKVSRFHGLPGNLEKFYVS